MLREIVLQPGLYTNDTRRGAKNRWRDANNVRFRDGLPEKVGGWVDQGVQLLGVPRTVHDWVALDGTKWMAIGTDLRVYLYNSGTLYNITPISSTGTLTNPFTTVSGSKTVTVAHTSHGESVGNVVTFSGATAVGGLTLNGDFIVQTVPDANHYTITAASAATSSATGGGTVTYTYEINAAPTQTAAGWGQGAWGSGAWDALPPIVDPSVVTDTPFWSLDNFGENLIICLRDYEIFQWVRSTGPSVRAALLTNSPLRNNWMVVEKNARIIVAFGSYDGVNHDPLLINWCDQEAPTVWTATYANRAGSYRLGGGSRIITALSTRQQIIIFTDESLFGMQYIGGQLVFSFTPLGQATSIMGPRAAVDVSGTIYFMGVDNFYIYDGTVRVLPCDVRTTVFGSFNNTYREHVVASVNKEFSEIIWYYPSGGSTENNSYVVYNYKDQVWQFGSRQRSATHDYSSFANTPYALTPYGRLFYHETGYNDADPQTGVASAMLTYLESYDFEMVATSQLGVPMGPGDTMAHLSRLIPDFQSLQAPGQLTVYARQYPESTHVSTKGPYNVTSTTGPLNVRARGRQMSIRFVEQNLNSFWRMGTWRSEINPDGTR